MQWFEYWRMIRLIGGRYFIIAGIAFLIFYVLFNRKLFYKKIQHRTPRIKDYSREIIYSAITISIFAAVPVLILKNPAIAPHTSFYVRIDQHGWFYFFFAFPMMFAMHDTYFYWTHRLMHHKKLFRWLPSRHHHSTNPSPWAAYSFHPLEAFVKQAYLLYSFSPFPSINSISLFFSLS